MHIAQRFSGRILLTSMYSGTSFQLILFDLVLPIFFSPFFQSYKGRVL